MLTLPVFALLGFTYVHPLVSTILLGVTYSFAAVRVALLLYFVYFCAIVASDGNRDDVQLNWGCTDALISSLSFTVM